MDPLSQDSPIKKHAPGWTGLRPFRPAPWLPGPHLQTLGGRTLRPTPNPGLQRERLDTPDGDVLLLDMGPEPVQDRNGDSARAPLALVLHGLEGSTDRNYARLAMAQLHRRGLRPIGLNFRSCGGEPNRKAHSYHAGETGDLDFVLRHLTARFPDRSLVAMGFSLGGNILLKYLGERGKAADEILQAAVAVSVPFDLTAGTEALETGSLGWAYTRYFLRKLHAKARAKTRLLEGHIDVDTALTTRTLREWDDLVTAPLHGFKDAADYYRHSSSLSYLPRIRVPTLLLQARDDPFLPDGLPHQEVKGNDWLVAGFTEKGGHVGFVEGTRPGATSFWAEEEGARFLAEAPTLP